MKPVQQAIVDVQTCSIYGVLDILDVHVEFEDIVVISEVSD